MTASPKRQAALAAAAAEAAAATPAALTDASGARIRTVGVHLTPFAPRCENLAIDNPRRWAVLYGKSPQAALMATLKRIARTPGEVRVQAFGDGVDVLARPPAYALGKVADTEAAFAPFATFTDGLTEAEAVEALAALAAAGWAPATPIQPS